MLDRGRDSGLDPGRGTGRQLDHRGRSHGSGTGVKGGAARFSRPVGLPRVVLSVVLGVVRGGLHRLRLRQSRSLGKPGAEHVINGNIVVENGRSVWNRRKLCSARAPAAA